MKRKIRKIAGAIFMALAIAFSQVPASFANALSPEVEFKRDGNTLISYTGTASVVSVPNGIRIISTDAFASNPYIETVRIPTSVEIIENGAFRDCPLLDTVIFSDGLQTIESGAFAMCPELDTVRFSKTIVELGAGVFSGDRELKSVTLGENDYFVLSDGALYNRDKTKLIQVFAGREFEFFDMPDSVTDIERYAFWGCDNLEQVELSPHLSYISEYSFSNCKNLSDIAIPYSVRKIAAKAFEDCVSLEYITLPASVMDIHSTAFDGCYDLNIVAQEGTPAYEFAKAFETNQSLLLEQENLTVSGNVIGEMYKDSMPGQKDNHPQEEQRKDAHEGSDTQKEKADLYDPSNPADVSKLNVSDYYGPDSADVIGKTRVVAGNAVILYDENIEENSQQTQVSALDEFTPDFVAPDLGDHIILKKEYYQATSFKNVTMDDTIDTIDDFAFARSSAHHVVIPEGVTHIGYGAFYHCDNLSKVEIPSTIESIEPEAFSGTKYLDTWKGNKNGSDFLVVGDGILLAYKGNAARIYLPENVKKIAGGVFQNHPEILEVALNDQLTEIGEDAFSGCTSLSKISGGKNLTKICDRAFSMCPLIQITIPDSVSEIGLGAFKLAATDSIIFQNKKTLPSVSFEKTATRIENYGYRNLVFPDIKTVVIPSATIEKTNTILDERYLGFRGLVITIPEEDSGYAQLVYCTQYPDERTGLIEIPADVRVNDKVYTLTTALPDAFDAYETYEYWGENDISGILLPPALGKLDDYDTQFTFSTSIPTVDENSEETTETEETELSEEADSIGTSEENEVESQQPLEYVTTIDLGTNYVGAERITADVLDDDQPYLLYVKNDLKKENDLRLAVIKEYGQPVEGQLTMFDLKIVERKSNVPITNFGDGKVEVSIPISDTMMDQNICAVTLTDRNQLQFIYGKKIEKEDQNYFVFRTNHFSAYGIYAGIGEVGESIKAESLRLLQKDESPETGEFFDPKWLLVIACTLLGLGLMINLPFKRKL